MSVRLDNRNGKSYKTVEGSRKKIKIFKIKILNFKVTLRLRIYNIENKK